MSYKMRNSLSFGILFILIVVGIIQLQAGETGFGTGLIGGSIGAAVGKYFKSREIKELQDKGLNPYDERAYFIAGKAAYSALSAAVIISALFVIIGSIAGPIITVNPYNFLGSCLAILVLLYLIFYLYYNRSI